MELQSRWRRRYLDIDDDDCIEVAAFELDANSPVFLQLSFPSIYASIEACVSSNVRSLLDIVADEDKKALLHREFRLSVTTFCNPLIMIIRRLMHLF